MVQDSQAIVTPAPGAATRHKRHAPAPGAACYNCGITLLGVWCHHCGQHAGDYHRSARALVWEAMEHLFSADGRVWHTVPRLLFRPGVLTREYLAGKRVPQVPPLRLFFIVLIIVFLVGNVMTHGHQLDLLHFEKPEEAAKTADAVKQMSVKIYAPIDALLTGWVRDRFALAIQHPDELVAAMGEWAHDFAFLTLPVSATILSVLFFFNRRFVLFDHLVFTMHSLSFQGLLVSTALIFRTITGSAEMYLLWLAPVHLFVHMRGAYNTSVAGTLLRMAVLFCTCTIAFSVLMAALVLAGLQSLHA